RVVGVEAIFGDLGQMGPWLFQVALSLAILWTAVGMNIVGLKSGRWVQNTGGIATWIAVLVLVV
ncbi:MAG: hypothetical protein GWO24_15420, partial [Akkermansiaceae bacterium]|nr:hypothetical protein [Akkermansiaceae bacterium]